MDAELVKIYFQTHGIDVQLFEEATIYNVIPVTFGRAQIFIEKINTQKAHALLEEYERKIAQTHDKGETA